MYRHVNKLIPPRQSVAERKLAIDTDFTLTYHAAERCAQRNLSHDDIQYVIQYGRRVYNAGTCEFFLGKQDIPRSDRTQQRITQLEGTVVQVDIKAGVILTVYRNRENGLKDHRRKSKYNKRNAA